MLYVYGGENGNGDWKKYIEWIKCLFSKQAIASLDTIAKDTSLTGLVGVLFECCAAAMLIALIPVKTMSSVGNLIGSFTGGYGMSSFGDNFESSFSSPLGVGLPVVNS